MKSHRLYALFLLLFSSAVFANTDTLTATVISAHVAGNYVYIQTDGKDKEEWLATTKVSVKEGDQIEYVYGQVMTNFPSKALDRTFDRILFVSRLHVVGGDSTTPTDALRNNPAPHPKIISVRAGELEKLDDGKTVAEVLQDADKLNGQTIRMRAKVIKISRKVMGKNWVTLKDGSGSTPNDKLIATTQQDAEPGDIVVVEGTARTHVDLGSGYSYPIVLEQAKLTR